LVMTSIDHNRVRYQSPFIQRTFSNSTFVFISGILQIAKSRSTQIPLFLDLLNLSIQPSVSFWECKDMLTDITKQV
jgi:hypothetical protein